MDGKWWKGSKQYVDFTVTLQDPAGDLTLSEVEAVPFEVLVQRGTVTPELDDAGWVAPSEKVVTADGTAFKVTILHMYQAVETGFHTVFVKFGPTPEEPVYQAASFVVL